MTHKWVKQRQPPIIDGMECLKDAMTQNTKIESLRILDAPCVKNGSRSPTSRNGSMKTISRAISWIRTYLSKVIRYIRPIPVVLFRKK